MDFNKPETWDETIHNTPNGVDVRSYQTKINSICGLNEFGKPNILLTWMPAEENYSRYYTEWDTGGFGTKSVLREQYVYETVYEGETPIDIPPPRWALKQFVHPSRYLASEAIVRWKRMTVGQQVFVREIRPPKPATGYYTKFRSIGRHNGFCCRKKKKEGLTCWGDYRKPDESYLLLLKKAVAIRDAEGTQNPNNPLSEETMRRAALEAANEIKAKEEREDAEQFDFVTSNLDAILARITKDNSFLARKKDFSFPGKTTESGLIIL